MHVCVPMQYNWKERKISFTLKDNPPPQALSRIVTHAIETLGAPVHQSKTLKMGPNVSPPNLIKRPSMFTFYWPRICMDLAADLNADEEFIRRHFVIELYSFGHDDLASTVGLDGLHGSKPFSISTENLYRAPLHSVFKDPLEKKLPTESWKMF